MQRIAIFIAEYLLGFLALMVFSAVAFGSAPPNDEKMVFAFKVGAGVAAVELLVLLSRRTPANRLILGANAWLLGGGIAAVLEQWWWLRGYQQLGEASLFLALFTVGLAATLFTPTGFVAVVGPRKRVVWASVALLAAVVAALWASVRFRGDIKLAAVVPVIALSWLLRLLRQVTKSGA